MNEEELKNIEKVTFKDKKEFIDYLVNQETIYHISVGQMRYIADCAMLDLFELLKTEKGPGRWKLFVKNAYKYSSGEKSIENIWKQHFTRGLDLFYDTNDYIKDDMAQQLMYLEVATRNVAANLKNKNLKDIKAKLLYTLALYELDVKCHEGFMLKIKYQTGLDVSELWEAGHPRYIVKALQAAVRDLIPVVPPIDTVMQEKAIINKLLNHEYLDRMIYECAKKNGGYQEHVKKMEEEMEEQQLEKSGVARLREKFGNLIRKKKTS